MFSRSLLDCARLTYRTTRQPKLCSPTTQPMTQRVASTAGIVCAEDEGPRCSPRRLAKSDCIKEKKKEKRVFPFKALLYKPECCEDPCPDVFPRFDDLYYTITDKTKVKYERTWVECKSPLIRKKKVCPISGIKRPPLLRRKFSKAGRQKTCEVSKNAWRLGLMDCKKSVLSKCPRLNMPGCKASRIPALCLPTRSPSDCKKRCTPYPSFSECNRPPLRKGKPVECFCLGGASNCEIVLYLLQQQKIAKTIKK